METSVRCFLCNFKCTAPNTCERCGKTEGAALSHSWRAADCTTPMTCQNCGKTEGEVLDHAWVDATYSSPATCSVCGETEGKSLGLPLALCQYSFTSNETGSNSDVNIGMWTDVAGDTYMNAIRFWVMDSYGMSDTEYIEYALDGAYDELSLTMAAGQGGAANTSSKIMVYADGELLYESEWIGNNVIRIETTLSISDCRQLRIVCTTDSPSSCYCIVTGELYA